MKTIINDISIVPTPIGVSLAPSDIPCSTEVCVSYNEPEGVLTIGVYQNAESDHPVSTFTVKIKYA